MNRYTGQSKSRTFWTKQPKLRAEWDPKQVDAQGKPMPRKVTSEPFWLQAFEDHLESGTFDYKSFELYDPLCPWLDPEVSFAMDGHFADTDGTTVQVETPTTFGRGFPIIPNLDREGATFSSFQLSLQRRVRTLRTSIVQQSEEFQTPDWFQLLRSYASECVALIDMTLHQIYYKAKYSPMSGWVFDAAKLGNVHARRLKDKVRWIHQITGKPLDAQSELRAFDEVKSLRNHLQHFDPPCLCFTLELDVVPWLNASFEIAQLAWKIRAAVGSPLSVPLIELLLAPEVEFVPKPTTRPRAKPQKPTGYASTRWPNAREDACS